MLHNDYVDGTFRILPSFLRDGLLGGEMEAVQHLSLELELVTRSDWIRGWLPSWQEGLCETQLEDAKLNIYQKNFMSTG